MPYLACLTIQLGCSKQRTARWCRESVPSALRIADEQIYRHAVIATTATMMHAIHRGSALARPCDCSREPTRETRTVFKHGSFILMSNTRYPQVCIFKVWLLESNLIQPTFSVPRRHRVAVPRFQLPHAFSTRAEDFANTRYSRAA